MKNSGTNFLAAVLAVAFLFAFIVAIVKSSDGGSGKSGESLLNSVGTVEAALAQAKLEGKTVMIDFNAEWCGPCQKMKSEAFTDESVAELLKDTLFVSIDVDQPGENQNVLSEYGQLALPTIVLSDSDGKEIGRTVGYGGVESFKSEIRRILVK